MATDTPNVLVLHADQHRWDCLGAYGNNEVKTPHLDAIANDGTRYDNCFCTLPICTPSRYSLVTGQYVHQHLGWTNHCTLPAGAPCFPKVLRERGYRTKAVGKMHFTPTYLDVGFDEMLLAEQDGPGRFDDDYHRWLAEEGVADRLDLFDQRGDYRHLRPEIYHETFGAMESDLDEKHHNTTWIGDRAVETLEDWEGGGQCLMVGFMKPHHPFDPPAPWSTLYDPDALTPLPGWTDEMLARDRERTEGYLPNPKLTEPALRRIMAMYYGTISQIDHHVGRMIDILKRKGLYDNTLIVYTSDHGDYMGFHHMILKGNWMYDPLVRVPFLLKLPGGEGAGRTTDAQASIVDITTTLLAATGSDVPADMAGIDLRQHPEGREHVFATAWGAHEYMVRTRDRKLLLCKDEDKSHFYDLAADPLEMENRFDHPAHREEVECLRRRLAEWTLFEARTPTHLDYDAPVCQGERGLRPGDGHDDEQIAYFRKKMEETGWQSHWD